jgi:hypothetical protein
VLLAHNGFGMSLLGASRCAIGVLAAVALTGVLLVRGVDDGERLWGPSEHDLRPLDGGQ